MSQNPLKTLYRCTQSELYAVCRIVWLAFQSHLAIFTSKKAFYDAAFALAALAEIEAAQNLPDYQERGEVTETLRIQLVKAGEDCLLQWRLLKSYIEDAFDIEFHKSKTDAAGAPYYLNATRDDWEDLKLLMSTGGKFIASNEATLMDKNNMPASFVTDFTNSMNTFSGIYDDFKKGEGEVSNNTLEKVKANNALYTKMMKMMKDGRIYFAKDPAIKQRFVFNRVLKMVSSAAGAGLKGEIINSRTGGGLANAAVSLYEGTNVLVAAKYTALTGSNGAYDFKNIASGNYTLKMEHTGFITRTEAVQVKVGVSSTKTFMLTEVA